MIVEDPTVRRLLLPIALLLATAACTSRPTTTPTAATGTTTTTSTAAVPGALPGNQVEGAVKAAFQQASAVHVAGTIVNSSGSLTLDLQLNKNHTAAGTVNEGGATIPLRAVDGTYYVQFTPQLISASTDAAVRQAGAKLTNKWVTGSSPLASGIVDNVKGLLDYDSFLQGMFSTQSQVPTATTTDTVDNVPVIVYEASDGASVSVATASPHYLMRLTAPSSGTGSIDFTNWNKPVPVSAPTDLYQSK
ncbi:MAG TPA: hypothetical protein VHF06_11685 [Pseudonocardiaceae bacterium]|nr:hypothetical protein [Pseudonocardiaceae bacterium]